MTATLVISLVVVIVCTLGYGLFGIWSLVHHGRKVDEMMKREFPSQADK